MTQDRLDLVCVTLAPGPHDRDPRKVGPQALLSTGTICAKRWSKMSQSPTVDPADLDALVERLVLGNTMPNGQRLLGAEFERLLLDRKTGASAPLDFCRQLLADLAEAPGAEPVHKGSVHAALSTERFALSLEPGGQLEVATPPFRSLSDIDRCIAEATTAIEQRLADTPYELACLGHAPVTPVEQIDLLPRDRYRIMDQRMPTRGALTRNMMRATAGFQVSYDVKDREDAGLRLALLYRYSPVLLAISANSRMVAGQDSGYVSFRHHVWWHTDRDRTGIPEGSLHPETAVDGYIHFAKSARMLFLSREGRTLLAPDESLATLVRRGEITEADVELHLTSLFPLVRLRNTLELRCFDVIPWHEARSLIALVSGLIYCDEALADVEGLSRALVVAGPDGLAALHEDAARRGLDAAAPDGRSFREIAREMVTQAATSLGRETCNWAGPEDLRAIADRIR